MQGILFMRLFQVCLSQIEEILLLDEDVGTLITDVEEFLKIVELVGGLQLFNRTVIYFDTVPSRQFKIKNRFQGPFDMNMEFRFGHSGNDVPVDY